MEESYYDKKERELREQGRYKELDKMFLEEIGFQEIMPTEEIMKLPLPMSYEDYFMLKWRYMYNTGKAYCTMPEPWKTQWLEWERKEMKRHGIFPY